jgi:hypothetical protein
MQFSQLGVVEDATDGLTHGLLLGLRAGLKVETL